METGERRVRPKTAPTCHPSPHGPVTDALGIEARLWQLEAVYYPPPENPEPVAASRQRVPGRTPETGGVHAPGRIPSACPGPHSGAVGTSPRTSHVWRAAASVQLRDHAQTARAPNTHLVYGFQDKAPDAGRDDVKARPRHLRLRASQARALRPLRRGIVGVRVFPIIGRRRKSSASSPRWAEGALDHRVLLGARGVVGVDQRRLEVAVAHPLLDGAHRHPGGGHLGAEGVAQVVEADRPQPGAPAAPP